MPWMPGIMPLSAVELAAFHARLLAAQEEEDYEPYRGAAGQPSNPIEGEIEEELERQFQMHRRLGMKRPPKRLSITLGHRLGVTSQNIGKWLARRAKLEDGEPVQQQKTPEQLEALEAAIEDGPYPSHDDIMRIAEETSLTKKQISSWFGYQRKKRGIVMDFMTGIIYYDVFE